MGILDFFSQEAGQKRRKMLDGLLDPIDKKIYETSQYYLGPHMTNFLDKGLNVAEVANQATDTNEALLASKALMGSRGGMEILKNAGLLGTNTAMAMLPGNQSATMSMVREPNPNQFKVPTPQPSSYDSAPGSQERYLGQAEDRSDLTYLRYKPGKLSDRLTASLEALRDPKNPTRIEMMQTIMRGKEIGGSDWYNTEELRDWFVKELGKSKGDKEWRDFMYLMGTTSPGSKVDPNIGNASAVRRRMFLDEVVKGSNKTYMEVLKDVTKLDDAKIISKTRAKGYGHKTQGLQELNTAKYAQGRFSAPAEPGVAPTKSSMVENPKPKGFSNSLLGNTTNMAGDLHFTRYMAMASRHPDWLSTGSDVGKEFKEEILQAFPKAKKYFGKRKVNGKIQDSFNPKKAVTEGAVPLEALEKYPNVWAEKPRDNEYGAFEDLMKEIGEELNMTPSQVQANLWMGASDKTGVDPSSQGTFMDLFRRRADKKAKATGKTREQVIKEFIKDKGLLAVPMAGGVGLGFQQGGLLTGNDQGGDI